MTIAKALEKFKRLRPGNVFIDSDLIEWLSNVDGRVYNDIVLTHEGHELITFTGYTSTTPTTTDLLIPEPYSEAYIYYLMSMADFNNEESARYANSTTMFNREYGDFAAIYSNNLPAVRYYLKFEEDYEDEVISPLSD